MESRHINPVNVVDFPRHRLYYVACPYTHDDSGVRQMRFELACRYAGVLINSGLHIFCPIVQCHPIANRLNLPKNYDFWRNYDEHMLRVADALIVIQMDGWERSYGVTHEIAYATDLQKPVHYLQVQTLQEWLQHNFTRRQDAETRQPVGRAGVQNTPRDGERDQS